MLWCHRVPEGNILAWLSQREHIWPWISHPGHVSLHTVLIFTPPCDVNNASQPQSWLGCCLFWFFYFKTTCEHKVMVAQPRPLSFFTPPRVWNICLTLYGFTSGRSSCKTWNVPLQRAQQIPQPEYLLGFNDVLRQNSTAASIPCCSSNAH